MTGKWPEYRGVPPECATIALALTVGVERHVSAVTRTRSRRVPNKPQLKVLLCSPRGFCAGVVRAINSVERALERYGAPVYVRHEIVHNRYVVEGLQAKGAVFVEELDEVPDTARR